MTTTREIEHWHTIQSMLRGYRVAHILITCTQIGIFQYLANGPQTVEALATQTQTDSAALQRLLNAAVALDLLIKADDVYTNASLASACLAQESPTYLGNLVRREGAFYQRWSYLTEAVRTGQRPDVNIRVESQDNWVLDFEMALFDVARTAGPAISEALPVPTEYPIKGLDVGGGHGGYSMALARQYPNLQMTVYELPAAAEVARQIIAQERMTDRVAVQNGDFQQAELGVDFDLILLFGVLVSETAEGKRDLLQKTYRALAPGGIVAIRGFWLNEDRTGPAQSPLFSLHMLLSTESGDLSTFKEIQSGLTETGFAEVEAISLPDWLGSSLLIAKKPM